VREVAERLAVCTATVYALVECGEIRHLRVSNAIGSPQTTWRGDVLASSGAAPYNTSKALSS